MVIPATVSAPPAAAPDRPAGPRPPGGPQTAPHGSDITQLAALDDGGAVVSSDLRGGLRLWPALDGTREPVVVVAPPARSLAMIRDGEGFTIGVLDAAGGLHVIRTTGAGAVRERLTLPGDAAVTELEATTDRLLALRADQTLDVLGPAGKLVAHLPAEPGSHIDEIVTRGPRALALILEDKQVHGRWIELANGAAWGAATGKIDGKIASAALSPDAALLAINRPRSVHPVLFDLAAGKLRTTPVCVSKGWPREEGFEMDDQELVRQGTAPVVVGFLSGGIIACSVLAQLTWWTTAGEAVPQAGGSMLLSGSPSTVTAHGVIAGEGSNLGLSSVIQAYYLGYGMHNVAHVYPGPGGALIAANSAMLAIDGELAPRARFDVARRNDWAEMIPLDERYAVALRTKRPYGNQAYSLSVFDGVSGTEHQVLPYDVRVAALSYEPSTRLLAVGDGGISILLPYDPASHTFGAAIRIADENLAGTLRVVDPKLADGVAAIKIDDGTGSVRVSEILARDVVPGGVATPQPAYTLPGALRAVDRAGRIYLREAEQGDVTVYRHSKPGAKLLGMASRNLRPNADGSLIAASDTPRLALLDVAGRVKWDVQHWDNQDVGWIGDGLIAQFSTGVAQVGLANGALRGRRCGWSFGLSEMQFDQGQAVASLCDVSE